MGRGNSLFLVAFSQGGALRIALRWAIFFHPFKILFGAFSRALGVIEDEDEHDDEDGNSDFGLRTYPGAGWDRAGAFGYEDEDEDDDEDDLARGGKEGRRRIAR